jgi:hypothetical protein
MGREIESRRGTYIKINKNIKKWFFGFQGKVVTETSTEYQEVTDDSDFGNFGNFGTSQASQPSLSSQQPKLEAKVKLLVQ